MEIRSKYKIGEQEYSALYVEDDPTSNLEDGGIIHGVHCYSFIGDKTVVVNNGKGRWTPPGGGIEAGETYLEAGIREVKEESNMKVIHQEFIGYQDITWKDHKVRQARTFCIIEPYGDFVSDPDGDIIEIKFIDPKDYKQYFDWGEIGDRIMQKALELKELYDSRTHLG